VTIIPFLPIQFYLEFRHWAEGLRLGQDAQQGVPLAAIPLGYYVIYIPVTEKKKKKKT
jgi:hypothetical protein